MDAIKHLKRYRTWFESFESFEYFERRKRDILFIGFQENLDHDFMRLKEVLNIPDSCQLPKDDFSSHKNPINLDTSISNSGVLALENWYEEDLRFISICKGIMNNS